MVVPANKNVRQDVWDREEAKNRASIEQGYDTDIAAWWKKGPTYIFEHRLRELNVPDKHLDDKAESRTIIVLAERPDFGRTAVQPIVIY